MGEEEREVSGPPLMEDRGYDEALVESDAKFDVFSGINNGGL